jgi:hypothetical protein
LAIVNSAAINMGDDAHICSRKKKRVLFLEEGRECWAEQARPPEKPG